MKSDDYAKNSAKDQKSPRTNKLRAKILSASFDLKISLVTDKRKIYTRWLCVKSYLKRNIPIVHVSPSLAAAYVILMI